MKWAYRKANPFWLQQSFNRGLVIPAAKGNGAAWHSDSTRNHPERFVRSPAGIGRRAATSLRTKAMMV
jgi:hypothetical protein